MTKIPEHIKAGAGAKALRYLGYRGNEPDEATAGLIEQGFKELSDVITVESYCSLVNKSDIPQLLIGNDVNRHLEGCERVIVTATTLGAVTDRLIRIAEIRNMAYALVLDALASGLIEEYSDSLDEHRCSLYAADGKKLYCTWRFSPGYGDFPIEIQPALIQYLNADKYLGLTVTENYILLPRKSITGVIGLSENELSKGLRGCPTCSMRKTCTYRKDGITCGGQ